MQIACPECDKKYKIDEAKIPEKGARLTCKDCGHQFVVRRAPVEDAPEPEPIEEDITPCAVCGGKATRNLESGHPLCETHWELEQERAARFDPLDSGGGPGGGPGGGQPPGGGGGPDLGTPGGDVSFEELADDPFADGFDELNQSGAAEKKSADTAVTPPPQQAAPPSPPPQQAAPPSPSASPAPAPPPKQPPPSRAAVEPPRPRAPTAGQRDQLTASAAPPSQGGPAGTEADLGGGATPRKPPPKEELLPDDAFSDIPHAKTQVMASASGTERVPLPIKTGVGEKPRRPLLIAGLGAVVIAAVYFSLDIFGQADHVPKAIRPTAPEFVKNVIPQKPAPPKPQKPRARRVTPEYLAPVRAAYFKDTASGYVRAYTLAQEEIRNSAPPAPDPNDPAAARTLADKKQALEHLALNALAAYALLPDDAQSVRAGDGITSADIRAFRGAAGTLKETLAQLRKNGAVAPAVTAAWAQTLLSEGNDEDAGLEATSALAKDADHADAHYVLALTYLDYDFSTMDVEKGLEHLQAAVENEPDMVRARWRMARVLADMGRMKAARKEIAKAKELSPAHPGVAATYTELTTEPEPDVPVVVDEGAEDEMTVEEALDIGDAPEPDAPADAAADAEATAADADAVEVPFDDEPAEDPAPEDDIAIGEEVPLE